MAIRMQARTYVCMYGNCGRPAHAMPRLYVPCSPLSPNRVEPITMVLAGLTMCDRCFPKLTAREVLEGERGAQLREAIELAFRQKRAYPSFDKAAIGRISVHDHDWQRAEEAMNRAKPN